MSKNRACGVKDWKIERLEDLENWKIFRSSGEPVFAKFSKHNPCSSSSLNTTRIHQIQWKKFIFLQKLWFFCSSLLSCCLPLTEGVNIFFMISDCGQIMDYCIQHSILEYHFLFLRHEYWFFLLFVLLLGISDGFGTKNQSILGLPLSSLHEQLAMSQIEWCMAE